jgi:hypothetical protein
MLDLLISGGTLSTVLHKICIDDDFIDMLLSRPTPQTTFNSVLDQLYFKRQYTLIPKILQKVSKFSVIQLLITIDTDILNKNIASHDYVYLHSHVINSITDTTELYKKLIQSTCASTVEKYIVLFPIPKVYELYQSVLNNKCKDNRLGLVEVLLKNDVLPSTHIIKNLIRKSAQGKGYALDVILILLERNIICNEHIDYLTSILPGKVYKAYSLLNWLKTTGRLTDTIRDIIKQEIQLESNYKHNHAAILKELI